MSGAAPSLLSYATVLAASMLGGAVNSVAAGGILLTFPVLVAAGVPPIIASATSTVALWPGNLSSVVGYRRALGGSRGWAARFALPSVLGGLVGGLLLIHTSAARFAALVPWLVVGATLVFLAQPMLVRALGGPLVVAMDPTAGGHALRPPSPSFLVFQFLVAIYGGYFGAGAGILMLAALGLMGLTNIHQMNGLKNWGALCFNAVAAMLFVATDNINWPMALTMAVGTTMGAYGTAGLAQRLPHRVIRGAVVVIGFTSAAWLVARAR
jgi:uncharacterized membrane protein YfcA